MAPVDVRLPTGWPRTLKILLSGFPCPAFSMFEMMMRAVLLELACSMELLVDTLVELELDCGVTPEEDFGVTLEEDCGAALEDGSSAGVQFSPMQNESVSPGVPISVSFSPVLAPLYQRIAG